MLREVASLLSGTGLRRQCFSPNLQITGTLVGGKHRKTSVHVGAPIRRLKRARKRQCTEAFLYGLAATSTPQAFTPIWDPDGPGAVVQRKLGLHSKIGLRSHPWNHVT